MYYTWCVFWRGQNIFTLIKFLCESDTVFDYNNCINRKAQKKKEVSKSPKLLSQQIWPQSRAYTWNHIKFKHATKWQLSMTLVITWWLTEWRLRLVLNTVASWFILPFVWFFWLWFWILFVKTRSIWNIR